MSTLLPCHPHERRALLSLTQNAPRPFKGVPEGERRKERMSLSFLK
jgi:hypothetical protein